MRLEVFVRAVSRHFTTSASSNPAFSGALLALVLAPALAACNGGGTEPKEPTGPLRVSVVAGDQQADTIQALLATPIRVQAVRGDSASAGRPAVGQLVNFVVVEPDCGRPFAGSATTDAQGYATERWELGTKAGTCHMEVRAVDQATGQPMVYATATATVQPGAVDTLTTWPRMIYFLGSSTNAHGLVVHAADRSGNVIAWPRLTLQVPAPWAVVGDDSIRSPATEDSTTITVGAGTRTAMVAASAVRDLRLYQFGFTLRCIGMAGYYGTGGAPVDSMVVPTVTIDTVHYGPWFAGGDWDADYGYVVWSGDGTLYHHDGTVDQYHYVSIRSQLRYQGPGSITWIEGNWNYGYHQTSGPAETPITYTGPALDWCFQFSSGDRTRTLSITLTPK